MDREQTPIVLVFSTSYAPLIGGAEIAINEITKRSTSLRFLVFTARGRTGAVRRESHDHVEIRRLGLGTSFDKWLLPGLAFIAAFRVARRERRVILWGVMLSQASIAAYFLKKVRPHIPLILTLQEGDSDEYIRHGRGGLIYFFWRRMLQAADGVTAISAYLSRKAYEAGFRGRPLVVPNGVDEHYVSEAFEGAPTAMFKEEIGIPADKRVIISTSRFVRKNGIADLIRAFAIVRSRGIDAKLLLVGGGEEEVHLRALVRDAGVDDDVIFKGLVPHDELLRYYRMSNVFVRPSYSEGLGNSFLEAMGAGIPVVATPVGGITDFIENEKTGIFVIPGDAASIAAGIERILNDDALARILKERGRELIIQKFLWVDIAHQMQNFFKGFIT